MDDELEAIRAARLQSLKSGNQQDDNKESKDEEMRASVLSQILTSEARERLARIRMVRGDRAKGIEEMLIRMARSGQIQQKVTEPELVSLLDQISRQEERAGGKTKIVFDNRRDADFDEDNEPKKNVVDDDDDDFFD